MISSLRWIADGAGTAAGAICPTYAILTSHIAIGSAAALIAGSIAGPLFFGVFSLFVYCSYKDYRSKKAEAEEVLLTHQNKFAITLLDYLTTLVRMQWMAESNLNLRSSSEKKSFIKRVQVASGHMLSEAHKFPLHLPPALLPRLIERIVQSVEINQGKSVFSLPSSAKTDLQSFIMRHVNDKKQKPISFSFKQSVEEFCKHFFPMFGSFSGGTTGVGGILFSMGLFAGFTAMPFAIGGIVIAASFVIAAIGGVVGVSFSKSVSKKNKLALRYQSVSAIMENSSKEWNDTMDKKLKLQRQQQVVRYKDECVQIKIPLMHSLLDALGMFGCFKRLLSRHSEVPKPLLQVANGPDSVFRMNRGHS